MGPLINSRTSAGPDDEPFQARRGPRPNPRTLDIHAKREAVGAVRKPFRSLRFLSRGFGSGLSWSSLSFRSGWLTGLLGRSRFGSRSFCRRSGGFRSGGLGRCSWCLGSGLSRWLGSLLFRHKHRLTRLGHEPRHRQPGASLFHLLEVRAVEAVLLDQHADLRRRLSADRKPVGHPFALERTPGIRFRHRRIVNPELFDHTPVTRALAVSCTNPEKRAMGATHSLHPNHHGHSGCSYAKLVVFKEASRTRRQKRCRNSARVSRVRLP